MLLWMDFNDFKHYTWSMSFMVAKYIEDVNNVMGLVAPTISQECQFLRTLRPCPRMLMPSRLTKWSTELLQVTSTMSISLLPPQCLPVPSWTSRSNSLPYSWRWPHESRGCSLWKSCAPWCTDTGHCLAARSRQISDSIPHCYQDSRASGGVNYTCQGRGFN